ncbi:MAG TPA: hypothetical protein DCM87_06795 [Planctomycetes bacterium]|nr:hypothetical protein [Planctomycetota bacterium]
MLLIDQLHPEEKVIAIGAAIGCFTYTAFAFYRGFWARSPFIWSRTLLPFLTATTGGSILWSGAVLLLSGAGGYLPLHADIVLGFTIYFACASVLLVFFLGCGWLFAAPRIVCPPGVRYRFRPLHPLARFLSLLLAAAGMAGACGCVLAAFSSAMHPSDRIPFLCGAAASLSAGLFFLRQGVRRTRGTIWEGYARPFLLAVAGGTIAVCVLFLVSGELRYRDERMIALIAIVCAGVFGAFAAAIKGRTEPLPHEAEFLRLAGAETQSRAGGSVLRGAAMMCWLVGVFLLLAGASVENGFWQTLLGSAFPADGSFARGFALGGYALLTAGTLFALAVRRGTGSTHVFRAVLGFAALWWAVVSFAAVASAFRVSPEFAIAAGAGAPGAFKGIVAGMIGIVLGSALVSWPCRRRIEAEAQVKER